jgi:anti-sigma factor RsiW
MSRHTRTEMSCDDVLGLLDPYLDSELRPGAARRLLQHLSACESCDAERKAREQVRAVLKAALQAIEPAAGFEDKLRARLRESVKPSPVGSLVQLAFAAAVLMSPLSLSSRQPNRKGDSDTVASASVAAGGRALFRLVSEANRIGLAGYLHCEHSRRHVLTPAPDAQAMAAELNEELPGLLALLEQAAPEGFRLVLGHCCEHYGRRFGHVVLHGARGPFSLLVTRRSPDESPTVDGLKPAITPSQRVVFHQSAERYQVASFETRDRLAFIICTLSRSDCLELAAALAPGLALFLDRLET